MDGSPAAAPKYPKYPAAGLVQPGSVVFVESAEGVTHRDYVTRAWTENPVKEVLVKMAATPALTRMAASTSSRASR